MTAFLRSLCFRCFSGAKDYCFNCFSWVRFPFEAIATEIGANPCADDSAQYGKEMRAYAARRAGVLAHSSADARKDARAHGAAIMTGSRVGEHDLSAAAAAGFLC